MIKLHTNLFGKKLYILGIYAISDDENAVVKEDFWREIKWSNSWNRKLKGNFNCRRFNSRTGEKINNLVVGPFGGEVINDNGDKLKNISVTKFIKNFELIF